MAIPGVNHTALGQKVIKLMDEYKARMSTPSDDRQENMQRIKMLQNIVGVAAPQMNNMDLTTATDVARIMFEKINEGWGTVYTESNLFRLGETLKGTAFDMDKLTMFITAFTAMSDAARDKSRKVVIDENRLAKVLKNQNLAIAICRIRDNINTRNGFKV